MNERKNVRIVQTNEVLNMRQQLNGCKLGVGNFCVLNKLSQKFFKAHLMDELILVEETLYDRAQSSRFKNLFIRNKIF